MRSRAACGAQPARWQAVLEILVTAIEDQITATMQTPGRPFLPLLGTLFIFLAVANLSALCRASGRRPPRSRPRRRWR